MQIDEQIKVVATLIGHRAAQEKEIPEEYRVALKALVEKKNENAGRETES